MDNSTCEIEHNDEYAGLLKQTNLKLAHVPARCTICYMTYKYTLTRFKSKTTLYHKLLFIR
jgi:hypothetical protein